MLLLTRIVVNINLPVLIDNDVLRESKTKCPVSYLLRS